MNRIKFDYCVKCDDQVVFQESCVLFVLKREKDALDECIANGEDPNTNDKCKQIIANAGNQIERLAFSKLLEMRDDYTIKLLDNKKSPFDYKYKLLIRFHEKSNK